MDNLTVYFKTGHEVDFDSFKMVWGKLSDEGRGFGLFKTVPNLSQIVNLIPRHVKPVSGSEDVINVLLDNYLKVAYLWNSEDMTKIFMFHAIEFESENMFALSRIVDELGLNKMVTLDALKDNEEWKALSVLSTPILPTGGNSYVPICSLIPDCNEVDDTTHLPSWSDQDDFDFLDSLSSELESKFPPVTTEVDEDRFIKMNISKNVEGASFIFNRNRKSYNGSLSSESMFEPLFAHLRSIPYMAKSANEVDEVLPTVAHMEQEESHAVKKESKPLTGVYVHMHALKGE